MIQENDSNIRRLVRIKARGAANVGRTHEESIVSMVLNHDLRT